MSGTWFVSGVGTMPGEIHVTLGGSVWGFPSNTGGNPVVSDPVYEKPLPEDSALRRAVDRWGFAAVFDEDNPDGRY